MFSRWSSDIWICNDNYEECCCRWSFIWIGQIISNRPFCFNTSTTIRLISIFIKISWRPDAIVQQLARSSLDAVMVSRVLCIEPIHHLKQIWLNLLFRDPYERNIVVNTVTLQYNCVNFAIDYDIRIVVINLSYLYRRMPYCRRQTLSF